MIKNIKTINGFVYILYQTDQRQSAKNRTCFGVFDSHEHAHDAAIRNNLQGKANGFVIVPAKINQFAEVDTIFEAEKIAGEYNAI